MSHDTYTEWACDRCGQIVRFDGRDQPTGWCRLLEVLPIGASLDEAANLAELCNVCRRDLKRFLEPIPKEADR